MSGKWDEPNVPKHGWQCIGVEDLGEPAATCEMCEAKTIRYVHDMMHPDYTDQLAVGCICAGHMEGDLDAPREREKLARNRARKFNRLYWVSRFNGSRVANMGGFLITIREQVGGGWVGSIEDLATHTRRYSRLHYTSENQIKRAALNAVLLLKERGWGR